MNRQSDSQPVPTCASGLGLSHEPLPDELVRLAFDSLNEPVCVVDRDGLIVVTNQSWSRVAGENDASLTPPGPSTLCLSLIHI